MEQHRTELKQCYQATKQILQNKDFTTITLSRATLLCLASAVISNLGEEASILRSCLKSATEDEVSVPRSAMMVLMKAVAKRLSAEQEVFVGTGTTTPGQSNLKNSDRVGDTITSMPEAAAWQGRVLVVGAGATGACTALRLRSVLGSSARIVVWEKARGAGGRMSTNRQDSLGIRADMGSPLLSLDTQDASSTAIMDLLIRKGVCAEVSAECLSMTSERPCDPKWRHLAGIQGGVNDALKAILDEAGAEVLFERRLGSLDLAHKRWRARPVSGPMAEFDAVVLAVPGCGVGGDNLNKIHGEWERSLSTEQNKRLLAVQHDQRWTFALFFPKRAEAACNKFFGTKAVEKIVDDDMVHLLCYQSRKTALVGKMTADGGLAIVVHTTVDWARKNSRANGRDQRLLDQVSERVKRIIGVPHEQLLASKVITWKQCHVTRPIPHGSAEGPCMSLSTHVPLFLAGDYFTDSNFTGCVKSAFAAADALAEVLVPHLGGGKRNLGGGQVQVWKRSRQDA